MLTSEEPDTAPEQEEHSGSDQVHHATRYRASNGEGTVTERPTGPTQDRPVLDGASESYATDEDAENPWRGVEDPQLERHPEETHE